MCLCNTHIKLAKGNQPYIVLREIIEEQLCFQTFLCVSSSFTGLIKSKPNNTLKRNKENTSDTSLHQFSHKVMDKLPNMVHNFSFGISKKMFE